MTLQGHTSQAWGVAFSPDGTRLASAGYDRTVRSLGRFRRPGVVEPGRARRVGQRRGVPAQRQGAGLGRRGSDRPDRRDRGGRARARPSARRLEPGLRPRRGVAGVARPRHRRARGDSQRSDARRRSPPRRAGGRRVASAGPRRPEYRSPGKSYATPDEPPEAYRLARLEAEEICRLDGANPAFLGHNGRRPVSRGPIPRVRGRAVPLPGGLRGAAAGRPTPAISPSSRWPRPASVAGNRPDPPWHASGDSSTALLLGRRPRRAHAAWERPRRPSARCGPPNRTTRRALRVPNPTGPVRPHQLPPIRTTSPVRDIAMKSLPPRTRRLVVPALLSKRPLDRPRTGRLIANSQF